MCQGDSNPRLCGSRAQRHHIKMPRGSSSNKTHQAMGYVLSALPGPSWPPHMESVSGYSNSTGQKVSLENIMRCIPKVKEKAGLQSTHPQVLTVKVPADTEMQPVRCSPPTAFKSPRENASIRGRHRLPGSLNQARERHFTFFSKAILISSFNLGSHLLP